MSPHHDYFKLLSPKIRPAYIAIYAAFIIIAAVISALFGDIQWNTTPEYPGGRPLEISFWATSLASAFVAFIMVEVLFRSRESRLLAPLPVPAHQLYSWQMHRVMAGIALTALPYAAAWLPHLPESPIIIALCIALWPIGLAICAIISAAIILYAGNKAAQNSSASSAMAFSTAPAIALSVSLVANLLLKLLAEALLKPGFIHAATAAAGIVAGIAVIMAIYAHFMFKRRYYAILANFIDTDSIVLNAAYDFLDGKTAIRMRSQSISASLQTALMAQFRRCHALSSILVATFAVILSLVLLYAPTDLFVPCLAAAALLIFLKPWTALSGPAIETGLITSLPITPQTVEKARILASLRLIIVPAILLTIAVFIPIASKSTYQAAILPAMTTFALIVGVSFGLSLLSQRYPAKSGIATGLAASLLGILALVI